MSVDWRTFVQECTDPERLVNEVKDVESKLAREPDEGLLSNIVRMSELLLLYRRLFYLEHKSD